MESFYFPIYCAGLAGLFLFYGRSLDVELRSYLEFKKLGKLKIAAQIGAFLSF